LLELQAKPESVEELKSTLVAILPDTRAFDGFEDIQVVLNQDDSCNLILIEKWETRQHQEKYIGWRAETGALDALGAMLSQPPSIRHYDDLGI